MSKQGIHQILMRLAVNIKWLQELLHIRRYSNGRGVFNNIKGKNGRNKTQENNCDDKYSKTAG